MKTHTLTPDLLHTMDAYWRAAVVNQTDRAVVVDLSDVLSVDDAGRELLTRMHESGASFVARGCAMRELVREVVDAGARHESSWVEEGRQA